LTGALSTASEASTAQNPTSEGDVHYDGVVEINTQRVSGRQVVTSDACHPYVDDDEDRALRG